MFEKMMTYELLDFLNSIVRANRVEEFSVLYGDALEELQFRDRLLAQPYLIDEDFIE